MRTPPTRVLTIGWESECRMAMLVVRAVSDAEIFFSSGLLHVSRSPLI